MPEPTWAERTGENQPESNPVPPPSTPGSPKSNNGCEGGCLLIVIVIVVISVVSPLFKGCLREPAHDEVVATQPTSSSPAGTDPCDEAMSAAAAVPLAETNDAEVGETLRVCDSYDAWASALRSHPDVIGLSNLTETDISVVLQTACPSSPTSAVCTDANSQGLIP